MAGTGIDSRDGYDVDRNRTFTSGQYVPELRRSRASSPPTPSNRARPRRRDARPPRWRQGVCLTIAGALVAAALSLVLIAFSSAIGLGILSSSPTWRDTSPALTVVSGIYLLLTALVSFGLGGYVVRRLRERWHSTAHSNVVEFPDGVHGLLSWAIAAVVSGLVIAASVAGVASKAVVPLPLPLRRLVNR
jgi:hypothetical protein